LGSVLGGREQPRHVRRIVREVAVHLDDELRALGERLAEARQVGRPEALLALAVQHADPVELAREPVRDLSGSVRGAVVDHEHLRADRLERADHALEVLRLVVGGQADRGAHAATYDRDMAKALPRNPDVAAQFDLLADLLEIGGEDAFRVVAYRRAANRIRETAGPVAQLALEGRAKELSGIGKTIEEK